METIITGLIEKLIIPKFGSLNYKVKGIRGMDSDKGSKNLEGIVVGYFNIDDESISNPLLKETKFILSMLGFGRIVYWRNGSNEFVVLAED